MYYRVLISERPPEVTENENNINSDYIELNQDESKLK